MSTAGYDVHLVYCESGIETKIPTYGSTNIIVHLVYCESGIETLKVIHLVKVLSGSFSLLRERY